MAEVDTWDALLTQSKSRHRAKRLHDEALAAAARLSLQLRLRYWRDKGRKPTHEKFARWCAKNLRSEQSRHFGEAAMQSRFLADCPLHWLQVIVLLLKRRADEALTPRRGRRKAIRQTSGTGMLSSMSPPPRPIGRPRALHPDDELIWLQVVYGVKLRLYLRQRSPDSVATFDETLRLLARDADRSRDRSRSRPVHAHLDSLIPDTDAVMHAAAQMRLPGESRALSKRLQRARDRYPYRLPDPA